MVTKRKKLGLWMTTALVIGNVIGSGIFMLPSSLGKFGTLGLFSWVLTGCGAIFLALVFARLSQKFPKVGGPYAFSRFALGDFVGFQVAWGYWIAVWISTAALVVTAVSYLSALVPALAASPVLGTWVAVGIIWFFTLINAFGAHMAGVMQVITTVLKLLPIVIVGVLGWLFVSYDHFLPINPTAEPSWQVLNQAAAFTLFAFVGIESATVPAEDVEKPSVTIPRATIMGTVICAVLYVLVTAAIMGIVPADELIKSEAPFIDAIQRMVSPVYARYVKIFIVTSALISCLGATNGWILLQAQVPYAAAKDKLFPRIFAHVSKRDVPTFGLFFSSILMTLFLLMTMRSSLVEQFNLIIIISVFTILVPYLYSSLAEIVLLAKGDLPQSKRKLFSSISIAGLAFVYSLWAMAGAGEQVVFTGALFLFASIPVYVWVKWRYREP